MFDGKEHQFDLKIEKLETGGRITVRIMDNSVIFEFEGKSAPISKVASSEANTIESTIVPRPKSSSRQETFEAMLFLLASRNPIGVVPKSFFDSEGNLIKLDKTCAEWAAETIRFDRLVDSEGNHALRPRV